MNVDVMAGPSVAARGTVEFWSHVYFMFGCHPLSGQLSKRTFDEIGKAADSRLPTRMVCVVHMPTEDAKLIAPMTDNCIGGLNDPGSEKWWNDFRGNNR